MGEKKVTQMVIKTNLDCEKCHKKVKKVLCRTPQVQDQVWDEKKNTVTIRVLCCSPEKIKDKIRYKGGDSILDIHIVVPKPPEKPKEPADKPKPSEKPKEAEKPKEKPKDSEKPKESGKPKESAEKPKETQKAPAPAPATATAPAPAPTQKSVEPVPGSVPVGIVQAVQAYPFPIGMSCSCPHCYGGVPGGPYCYGNGGPPAPQFYQYGGGHIGRPVYDSYGNGGGRGYNVCRNDYFSEENPQSCSIM